MIKIRSVGRVQILKLEERASFEEDYSVQYIILSRTQLTYEKCIASILFQTGSETVPAVLAVVVSHVLRWSNTAFLYEQTVH
mmetsp:Transcript_7078/g.13096  ORF Transcript_7078/g.13096 Transcript_7078/m.13096 type:complete len:82 (+) Transcript_7078:959-1204(+)